MSWRATVEGMWMLMLYVFITTVLSVLGVFLCIIGVFVTFPLGMALQGAAMHQLLGDRESAGPGVTDEGGA